MLVSCALRTVGGAVPYAPKRGKPAQEPAPTRYGAVDQCSMGVKESRLPREANVAPRRFPPKKSPDCSNNGASGAVKIRSADPADVLRPEGHCIAPSRPRMARQRTSHHGAGQERGLSSWSGTGSGFVQLAFCAAPRRPQSRRSSQYLPPPRDVKTLCFLLTPTESLQCRLSSRGRSRGAFATLPRSSVTP